MLLQKRRECGILAWIHATEKALALNFQDALVRNDIWHQYEECSDADRLNISEDKIMRVRFRFALVAVVFCAQALLAQQAQYKKHGPALLPDLSITKGAVRLRSKATVCSIKWGKDERHVTQAMKDASYKEYGTAPGKGVCALKTHKDSSGKSVTEGCEVDHLISRELGGDDKAENLWPQPYTQHPGAHEKDWLENELHKEVCNNSITLKAAQQEIKTDWYAAYLKRKPAK